MGMSIDEVIEHERQKANYYRIEAYTKGIQKYNESTDEHEQIASWLELLKHLIEKKEALKINAKALEMQGYNKGIDDFAEKMKYEYGSNEIHETIDEIAEELKAGGENV